MDAAPTADAGELVESKSDFARRLGVVPGRVTQYITEGKISAEALKGEGRTAQIRVAVALKQLNRNLDVAHRIGNGLGTNLHLPEPKFAETTPSLVSSDEERAATPEPPAKVEKWEDQIQREKLEEIQRKNRLARRDEAAEAGLYTLTSEVRREMVRLASETAAVFIGALPAVAGALAAKFEIPQRDALHLLRTCFKDAQRKAAQNQKALASALPENVDHDADHDADEDQVQAA